MLFAKTITALYFLYIPVHAILGFMLFSYASKMCIAVVVFILMFGVTAFAAPSLNISTPQNTTYNTTKINLNVTSNELVDFYTIGNKGRQHYLVRNPTNLNTYLYGRGGAFNVTIYANNSNGTASGSVVYSIGPIHNPINITSCGWLVSSNADYQLLNNISTTYGCLFTGFAAPPPAYNITVNLNGFMVEGGWAYQGECYYSKFHNGTFRYVFWSMIISFSDSCEWSNLKIEIPPTPSNPTADAVFFNDLVKRITFRDVDIRAARGFHGTFDTQLTLERVNITGMMGPYSRDVAFWHEGTLFDNYKLINVAVSNFTEDVSLDGNVNVEYTIANSVFNTTPMINGRFGEGEWMGRDTRVGITKINTQHLVIINLTDQDGNPLAGAVAIIDNKISANPVGALDNLAANPTAHVFTSTNNSGLSEIYLTQKVKIIKSFSPIEVEDVSYEPYIITAKSRGAQQNITLNFTTNSTIKVDISITFPTCTLDQLLDLNNDGYVNINDAIFVLRRITGEQVNVGNGKGCDAPVLSVPL